MPQIRVSSSGKFTSMELDEQRIKSLYCDGGWSATRIAREFGVSVGSICTRLHKMGVDIKRNDWRDRKITEESTMKSVETRRRLQEEGKIHQGVSGPKPYMVERNKTSNPVWMPGVKEKISKAIRKLWMDDAYKRSIIGFDGPTSLELKGMKIIEQLGLPYKFVGDGQVMINGKFPDFINCNGQKKIIEFFGSLWHNQPNLPYSRTEVGTKEAYAEYGYDTLVIWDYEMKDTNAVIEKIKRFDSQ